MPKRTALAGSATRPRVGPHGRGASGRSDILSDGEHEAPTQGGTLFPREEGGTGTGFTVSETSVGDCVTKKTPTALERALEEMQRILATPDEN